MDRRDSREEERGEQRWVKEKLNDSLETQERLACPLPLLATSTAGPGTNLTPKQFM